MTKDAPGHTDCDLERLLTVSEIAARWRIGLVTVRRKCASQELPAGNLGSATNPRYRVRLADLLAYERNHGLGPRDAT